MTDPAEVAYAKGAAEVEHLQQAVEEFFAAAGADEQIREDAEAAGVDLDALRAAGPDSVTVREGGLSQFTGAETILIGIAIHAGAKTFDEVILSWIKRRLSGDAVGAKQDTSS